MPLPREFTPMMAILILSLAPETPLPVESKAKDFKVLPTESDAAPSRASLIKDLLDTMIIYSGRLLFFLKRKGQQSPYSPEHKQYKVYSQSNEYHVSYLRYQFRPGTIIGDYGSYIGTNCKYEAGKYPVQFPAYCFRCNNYIFHDQNFI